MSITIRRVAWCLCVGLACAADEGDGDGETTGTGDPTTTIGTSSPTTTMAMETTSPSTSVGEASSTDPTAAEDSSSSEGGEVGSSSDDGDADSGSTDTGALEYDPEFVWVADFLRVNCSGCHATNMNGNLVLGSPDIDNEGVRVALDGVVALTGLLLVQPGDHMASQTWLQITNEFGAVFPVEDTDRFAAWIDAGAHYYVE